MAGKRLDKTQKALMRNAGTMAGIAATSHLTDRMYTLCHQMGVVYDSNDGRALMRAAATETIKALAAFRDEYAPREEE